MTLAMTWQGRVKSTRIQGEQCNGILFNEQVREAFDVGSERNTNRIFSGLILLVLAYEWLVSGLDKLLSGSFVAGLHQQFSDAVGNIKYGFYGYIVKTYFIPNSETLGYIVEIGELALGVAFVVFAIYALRGKMSHSLYGWALGTSILAVLLCVNLFLYQGGGFFLNPADPYDEGVSVDFVLILANAAVAVWSSMALWKKPKLYLVGSEKGSSKQRSRHLSRMASK